MTARQPKSHSQWRELRIQNPARFYDPKNQKKMVEDAKELGSNFFDVDPNRHKEDE